MYKSPEHGGILCVTNRGLCKDNFLQRIEKLAQGAPAAILLREKDLSKEAYESLAIEVSQICKQYHVTLILHTFYETALKLQHPSLHMPLPLLKEMSAKERAFFPVLGASCHSVSDALEAEALGCTYITAGHIFETNCKAGLPGRGLDFLRSVCNAVNIPVYGIGGITAERLNSIIEAGAKGACVMNQFMTCETPLQDLEHMNDLLSILLKD